MCVFLREHWQHISRVGSAEVLAMASNNLPTMLINIWFSPLVAGYFFGGQPFLPVAGDDYR